MFDKSMALLILKSLAFIIGHLPLGVIFFLGKILGALAYRLDKKRRNIALENIKRAYGSAISQERAEDIAKKSLICLATMFFEFLRMPWIKKDDLNKYFECEGIEHLQNALSRKKGVIMLTAHLGNWEYIGAFFGLSGYTLDVVIRDADSPLFDEFIRWARTRCANTMVSKRRAMRRLIKRLNEDAIAIILLDQNVARAEGVFVDFFNAPACTNKGPALLASATGASVVPAFIIRNGKGHRVIIKPEIPIANTGDKAGDTIENTRRFTKAIEDMIRERPEEWFWVHRRWKTRPSKEEKNQPPAAE
ncbi:MAG: lysophospholipid acyltransferase family protein [Deltaproteobacteria bacterium]|nr:lysophospholipid acyltransferase family protein [Deltaproteobacteria bacterium]